MHDLGIIARLVPSCELEAVTREIDERLAANASMSLAITKALMIWPKALRNTMPHNDLNDRVARISKTG